MISEDQYPSTYLAGEGESPRGVKARHQKIASFSALHREGHGEAKRTFHQWGGFLRSRIIPAPAASGGGSEGNDPQAPGTPRLSPFTSDPFSTPPYHPPPHTPPVRPEYDPYRGGKGESSQEGEVTPGPAENRQLEERTLGQWRDHTHRVFHCWVESHWLLEDSSRV